MWQIFKAICSDIHFLGAFLLTLIIILLGYFFRRHNLVDSAGKKAVTTFIWKITVPCVAFNAFMTDFCVEQFRAGLAEMIFAAIIYAVLFFAGKLMLVKSGKDISTISGIFVSVGQVTLFSMPILLSVYAGNESCVLIYISMISIIFRIMVYMISFYLISGEKFHIHHIGSSIKQIFLTPVIIAMCLGIFIWLVQNYTPQVMVEEKSCSFLRIDKTLPVLYQTVISLAKMLNPLSMFLIGMTVGEADFASAFKDWRCWIVACGRNFVAPVVALGFAVLLQVTGLFKFDEFSLVTLVVAFSAPVSVTVSLMCVKYEKEEHFAGSACLISTLFSLLSVPFSFVISYYALTLPIFK